MSNLEDSLNRIIADIKSSISTTNDIMLPNSLPLLVQTLNEINRVVQLVDTDIGLGSLVDAEGKKAVLEYYEKLSKFKNAVVYRMEHNTDNYLRDHLNTNPLKKSKEDQGFEKMLQFFNLFSSEVEKDIEELSKKEKEDKLLGFNEKIILYLQKITPILKDITGLVDRLLDLIVKKSENIKRIEKFENIDTDIAVAENKIERYTFRISFNETSVDNRLPYMVDFSPVFGSAVKELMKVDTFKTEFADTIFTTQEKLDQLNPLTGGVFDGHIAISKMSEMLTDLNVKIQKISVMAERYNYERNRKNCYLMFVFSIYAKDRVGVTEAIYYKYINKGLLFFYYQITKNILEKMDKGTEPRFEKIVEYFKEYHHYLLVKLNKFMEALLKSNKVETETVIDIFRSTGVVKENFLLLNEFKSQLEAYNEFAQKKVTIYARINDWGKALGLEDECDLDRTCKIFRPDYNDATILKVNAEGCAKHLEDGKGRVDNVKFTEVYDTQNFSKNQVISKYMSLETQLAKGKGLMMLTYGYSGVGKTVTLFGKSTKKPGEESIEGILQSTMNNIKDMKNIFIRVYELYGKGVQYPIYWRKDEKYAKLDHELIIHSITVQNDHLSTNPKELKSIEDTKKMQDYLDEDNYAGFEAKTAETLLENFDSFIKHLDVEREKAGRISSTPNNPESSRSIIVYDLLIEIEIEKQLKKVPFVIIDLPGREEIIESYADTYLKKYFMKDFTKDQEYLYNLFLSSLCLNSFGLAIVCPGEVFNFFNSLKYADRKQLFEGLENEEGGKIKDSNAINKLSNYITFDTDKKSNENRYKFVLKDISEQSVLGVPRYSAYNKNPVRASGKVDMDISKQTTGCLVALKRVIEKGRIDILSGLTKHLSDIFINDRLENWKKENLKTDILKKEFIVGQIIDPSKDFKQVIFAPENKEIVEKQIELLNEKIEVYKFDLDIEVDKKLKFNFFYTPFEGVYINENINGLVKYLARMVDPDEDKIKAIIPEQDQSLDFLTEKDKIKDLMRREVIYEKNVDRIEENENLKFVYDETHVDKGDGPAGETSTYKVYRKKDGWMNLYDEMKKRYKSNAIFRYEYPVMGTLLKHYEKGEGSTEFKKNVKKISDYKVFYLFSNTMIDLKCKHQIALLEKTRSFIKALEN